MISAFVITAGDEPAILRATLVAVSWADEVVLVDKGIQFCRLPQQRDPTNPFAPTEQFAQRSLHGIRIVRTNWSPTVEETRAFALGQTKHDWVVCLDADEILSPACEAVFRGFVAAERADVLQVPIRNYLLGRHDRRAAYWPEWRPCLFRRGALAHGPVVHAGTRVLGTEEVLPSDSEAHIAHLSSPDVATYVEKINRYTSRPERSGVGVPPAGSLREWAVAALQRYESRDGWGHDDYCDATALLRGLYDVVDGLKRWEATQPDAHEVYLEMARDVET